MKSPISWRIEDLVHEFDAYLETACGLSEGTRRHYGRHAREFLFAKGSGKAVDLSVLDGADVVTFVRKRIARLQSPKSRKGVCTALRSFFRFLQVQGLCEAELMAAVPTIPQWRLSSLPPSLSDGQLSSLVSSFDLATPIGLRGKAIVLCLADLGLRAGEVARLSLADLDLRSGTVNLSISKSRRASVLPLPVNVGRAIARYLRHGRPTTQARTVFVRHAPPVGGTLSSSAVRAVVRRAFAQAGIEAASRGTHILRHTAATRMLRGGASLKEIADVLRHRSLDTTAIYAKVDLTTLAAVAVPWPESR